MSHLYFMHKQFDGHCLAWGEAIESHDIQLLFNDSWYWLHYRFLNCRDSLCSEKSSALRTHLYNLVAYLYKHYEQLCETHHFSEESVLLMTEELIQICEYSKEFSICIWTYGDEHSKEALEIKLTRLPSDVQIAELIELPHFRRLEIDRLHYQYDDEKPALKRYRRELAAFNKRKKQNKK